MEENNDVEIITVGTVELSTISEEFLSEIGAGDLSLGSNIGFCNVEVRGNEGPIPHFHISSKSKKWECCICIYSANYFNHGHYTGTLNNKQLKILNDWLSEKTKIKTLNVTNWEFITALWQACYNPMINVPEERIQPDYTKTVNMIG